MSTKRKNESDNVNDRDEDDETSEAHKHVVVDIKGDVEEQVEDYDDDDDFMEYDNIFWQIISCGRIAYNFIEIVERYPKLVQQLDCDDNNYPLHAACRYCEDDTVILKLIELFPMALEKQNNEGCYPLHIALQSEKSDTVLMKLIDTFPRAADFRINYDETSGFALHIACFRGSETVVRKLIEINPMALQEIYCIETDEYSRFPIHCAINSDQSFSLICHIMEVDPLSVQRQTEGGESPLHMICRHNVPLVEYMVQHANVKINMRNQYGSTPLHIACKHGADKVVEKLLQHPDIQVNARDNYGETPLHMTSMLPIAISFSVVQRLLDHPFILINEKNNNNQTPLDFVKEKINELEERPGNIFKLSIDEGVQIVKVLEEFPVKRRWQSYQYFWELVMP